MEQRLSLITLGVADVARSRRFYEALGWRASGASQEEVAHPCGGRRDPGRGARGGRAYLKPARTTAWGGYAGYFADPDGHPWEVAWNPHFPLSDGRPDAARLSADASVDALTADPGGKR